MGPPFPLADEAEVDGAEADGPLFPLAAEADVEGVGVAAVAAALAAAGADTEAAEADCDRVLRAGEPGGGTDGELAPTAAVPMEELVPAAGESPGGADMAAAKALTFSHTAWPAVGRQMSETAR